MSPYMKKFVYASLFYLALATIFGILNGTMDLGYFGSFAHTHFSLLGFMAMIVFGIGYFILPRFNGTDLRFESWVPVHFWLANISLIGMVVFRGLYIESAETVYHGLFIASASVQVLSVFMFVVNIWVSLTPPKKTTAAPQTSSQTAESRPGTFEVTEEKSITVNADTPVALLVDTLPSLKEVLVENGLTPLGMPGHIDRVRANRVTLGTAARNHGLDLDGVIKSLESELRKNGFTVTKKAAGSAAASPAGFTSATLIGEVIRDYPGARAVFLKHFGSGCFDCPGQAYESIDMACRMHGVDTDTFLSELSAATR